MQKEWLEGNCCRNFKVFKVLRDNSGGIYFLRDNSGGIYFLRDNSGGIYFLRDNSGGIYLDHLYSLIMYIHGTSLKGAATIKKSPANYTLSITIYKRALELIRIQQILNHSDVIKTLPSNLQNRENILIVASRLVILLEINYWVIEKQKLQFLFMREFHLA